LAHRAVFPLHRTGLEVEAHEGLSGGAVDGIADADGAADVRLQLRREVDLGGGDLVAVRLETDEGGAGLGSHAEDAALMDDRRGDVGDAVGGLVRAPQEAAGLGFDADHAAAEELDVLADAADLADDDRSVRRGVAAGNGTLPARLAVGLVESDHGGLGAAGAADERGAVHERRLGVGPVPRDAAEVCAELLLPHDLRLQAEAGRVAVRSQRVQTVAVHGGRRARPGILRARVRADAADVRGPHFTAVALVEGDDVFRLPVGRADEVDASLGNGWSRVAAAEPGGLPGELRPAGGPLGEQAGLGRDAVALK